MRRIRVYVAGPLSKRDAEGQPLTGECDEDALDRADQMAQKLFMLGFNPYCPHSHTHEWMKNTAPEFHDYKRVVEEFDGDFLLNFCDCLFLLPGWQNSKGSLLEKDMATKAGMPIFERVAALLDWRDTWSQSYDPAFQRIPPRAKYNNLPFNAPDGGWHGHPKFYETLNELAELHDRKNHDYAGDGDPLRNLCMCEEYGGVPAWQGVVIRLTDKLSRLLAFMRQGELRVKDESVEDTFLDTAVYAILGRILFKERKEAARE